METENAIRRIHGLVTTRGDALNDAEAIKAYLVMPFLKALGHDASDLDQVAVGFRRGDAKIDFATLDDDAVPHMLVCILSTPENLDAPRARVLSTLLGEVGDIGLLTNGRSYRFHAVDAERQLVEEPFLAFDLSEEMLDPAILAPLQRDNYDVDAAIAAGRLTKLPLVAFDALLEQLVEGTTLHDMLASSIIPGGEATERSTAAVTEALARALRILRGEEPAIAPEPEPVEQDEETGDGRAMNGDEEHAFDIVRGICARFIDPSRIVPRPALAYTALLLDDNNRRTLCRLYFSAATTRYVGTFVGKNEKKNRIPNYGETARFAAEIEARLRELDPGAMAKYDAALADGTLPEPMTDPVEPVIGAEGLEQSQTDADVGDRHDAQVSGAVEGGSQEADGRDEASGADVVADALVDGAGEEPNNGSGDLLGNEDEGRSRD